MIATGASGGDDSETEAFGSSFALETIKDIIIHEAAIDARLRFVPEYRFWITVRLR